MTHPEIRIILDRPMPESVKMVIKEKRERRIARIAAIKANQHKGNSPECIPTKK